MGLTPDTAKYGTRLWDLYYAKLATQEQQTLSAVMQVARQLDRVPSVRDAMSVLDEEGIRNSSTNSSASTIAGTIGPLASTPATPSSSSTSLALGPIVLGAMEANTKPKRSKCARCGGRGHWSTVGPTPRDWKETDPIVGEGIPRGNGKRPETGEGVDSGGGRAWNKTGGGKGAQAHNTEAEASEKWDRDSESSEDREIGEAKEQEPEEQGKA